MGTRLDDHSDLPKDFKEAVRTVLDSTSHSASPVVAPVLLQSIQQAVYLTVIDALPLRRVPTDLRALLRSNLDVLQRQAKVADVTLTVAVDDHVPALVPLDAQKIAWATTVLVGNALRYVRRGSQTMPGGSIAVRVTYNGVGPEITIEVQDDGAGIPAVKLPLLFSAAPGQSSLGLGLSMIREVVLSHAGHIEVHSDTDSFRHGTIVRLTLPVW